MKPRLVYAAMMTLSIACLVLLSCLPSAQGVKRAPRNTSGFGRGLLQVADQDGDGIAELVIVDSSPGSKKQRFRGLFIYSPGANRCLRFIDVDGYLPQYEFPAAAVFGGEDAAFDLVYISTHFRYSANLEGEADLPNELCLVSSLTGKEASRISIGSPEHLYDPQSIYSLHKADDKASSEILLRLTRSWIPKENRDEELEALPWAMTHVISLPSGKVLRKHIGAPSPLADLDNDGNPDYLIENDTKATVHSGRNGKVLFEFKHRPLPKHEFEEYTYIPCEDMNGDGTRDILQLVCFGSYEGKELRYSGYDELSGQTRLLSGKGGHELWESKWMHCTGIMWASAATVADRDGDDVRDVVVTYSSEVTGFGSCPGWRVYSGATGKTLEEFAWEPWGEKNALINGFAVVETGDLDGDGEPEVALSKSGGLLRGPHFGEVDIYSLKKGLLKRVRRRELVAQLAKDKLEDK